MKSNAAGVEAFANYAYRFDAFQSSPGNLKRAVVLWAASNFATDQRAQAKILSMWLVA